MIQKKTELSFMHILLAGISVLAYFIFKPFLYVLILAIVLATAFDPVHKKILKITLEKKAIAALVTTILVLVVVVVPLSFLGIQIFQEASQLYSFLILNDGATNLSRSFGDALQSLARFSPVPIDLSLDVNLYLKQGLGWLVQNLGPFFADVAKGLLDIFIFLVALYYLFKDGHQLKKAVVLLSPLRDEYDETILHKLALAVNSILKGSLVVALAQGILTTIGFALFGVPNAVLWGTGAAIASLVPGVGTAIVLIPAIFYLFISGETFSGFGLLLWSVLIVGLIDNFLGPKLASQGMKLHSFLILLSILGGISFFGPIGFLMGPLVLSLLFVFIDIYALVRKEQVK